MTAVVAILGDLTAPVAEVLAQKLTGPCVVVPYDDLLHAWVAKPADGQTVRSVTANQIKLLTAGYVRAGFHVVIHGSLERGGRAETAGLRETLALMQTVPGVAALSARLGETPEGDDAPDVTIDSTMTEARLCAQRIWERIPPEALGA